MEKITLRGLVATTPRYIITAEGLKIASFRLASYTHERTASETNWYTITGFNDLAFNISESVQKGERVVLTGSVRIRDWDNGERSGTSVEVEVDALGHDLAYGTTKFDRNQIVPNITNDKPQHKCNCKSCGRNR